MTGFDLVVIGDCNADLVVRGGDVVPAFGQAERVVDEMQLTIGGSGGICAAGAARLGLRVAMAGLLGNDTLGRFMRESLTARGVDMSAVRADPRRPTGLSINLIRGDDRAILTHPGTVTDLRAEMVDDGVVSSARHVHVSSYFLQSGLWPGLPALLARARAAGATVSIDPNWDPAGGWDAGLAGLYGLLDFLLPNAEEAIALARAGAAAGRDPAGPEEAARMLAEAGPAVVVKAGADGAFAAAPGREGTQVPAVPGVEVEDSVGAGDSFDAGFLAATLWGWETRAALALGAACGALSTRAPGGTGAQPGRAEAVAAAEHLTRDIGQ